MFDMASDWPSTVLSANQKPSLKFFVDLNFSKLKTGITSNVLVLHQVYTVNELSSFTYRLFGVADELVQTIIEPYITLMSNA